VPTYDIDIRSTVIITQKMYIQLDITVTELNRHACRTSESSLTVQVNN